MRKLPTNIALDPKIQRRVRVVAGAMGVRACVIVEMALERILPELELQVLADEKAVKK